MNFIFVTLLSVALSILLLPFLLITGAVCLYHWLHEAWEKIREREDDKRILVVAVLMCLMLSMVYMCKNWDNADDEDVLDFDQAWTEAICQKSIK